MSTSTSSPSVGGTLAGGIQDVSAILPLIGTEQCEKHVGSALTGGYLYAAAAPLSIFGSLGIVKSGMVILISSISISIPKISISFNCFRQSIEYHGQQKWFGGRLLKDAGLELSGEVAPLIGIEGQRFRAETRLIEMLEEKHIDDPQNVSINWKSRKWNFMLALATTFGAVLSLTPYIALLLGPALWRPAGVHLPWLYPVFRIVGSCVAAVACQCILQSRMLSLMKSRLLFMEIDQQVFHGTVKDQAWFKDSKLLWSSNLPSEQCTQSLEKVLFPSGPEMETVEGSAIQSQKDNTALPTWERSIDKNPHTSIPIDVPQSTILPVPLAVRLGFSITDFHRLQKKHFPSRNRDFAFTILSWIMLALSLPATVAGYIGCFTLVSAIPASGNGPLVWVGLEAALSVLRIIIWASNPSFDEETEITVGIKLSSAPPIVTTHDYNPHVAILDHIERKPFTLVPEREFLERITPYTGPLDRLQKADNITLYFTLTTDYGKDHISEVEKPRQPDEIVSIPELMDDIEIFYDRPRKPEHRCLFMTVFDFNMQVGVAFVSYETSFYYFDVSVRYNPITRKLEANIQSTRRSAHPWRIEDDELFKSLENYYQYVIGSLDKRDINTLVATLPWKWNFSPLSVPAPVVDHTRNENPAQGQLIPLLTPDNLIYINCGYEHQLKTNLITRWSEWIIMDMQHIRNDLRNDCLEALRDPTCEKATWELTELDAQLVWGWARRELLLLMLSAELEDILRVKMESCASVVNETQHDEKLMVWVRSEFESGRQKRMVHEREGAKQRIEQAMRDAQNQADKEGRGWSDTENQPEYFLPPWAQVVQFIKTQWSAAIDNKREVLMGSEDELQSMNVQRSFWRRDCLRELFIKHFLKKVSHEHWLPQHKYEEQMMRTTIETIRIFPVTADLKIREELGKVYEYPEPDKHSTSKFAPLSGSPSRGKVYSAMVYDTRDCYSKEALYNVIAKKTTLSVVNAPSIYVNSIPPNDHLLFMHCRKDLNWNEGIKEPAFVQRNRDRWWDEQTTNSSIFFFTPRIMNGDSCSADNKIIARVFVFLTTPSPVHIGVLHRGGDGVSVFVKENSLVLGETSDVAPTFQLYHFQPFELREGRHELVLESKMECYGYSNKYCVRDIFVEFKNSPKDESVLLESSQVGSSRNSSSIEEIESRID